MELTMRWFGPADRVQLWQLRQILSLSGVVSALHDGAPCGAWTAAGVQALRQKVETARLRLSVIESIPVLEDIKLGNVRCEEHIQRFTESLRVVAGADGPAFRPHLQAFLQAVALGLPRVVSTAEDLQFILDGVPDEHSRLTFCLGPLGARQDNDLLAMIEAFAPRVHFVHARNVERLGERNFDEVAHVSRFGSTGLAAAAMGLEDLRPGVPLRPDHGHMIWSETGRPGYGPYNRTLGAMYPQGLNDAVHERGQA